MAADINNFNVGKRTYTTSQLQNNTSHDYTTSDSLSSVSADNYFIGIYLALQNNAIIVNDSVKVTANGVIAILQVTNLQPFTTVEIVGPDTAPLNYYKGPVSYATTTALPANTYNNGSSGVGATLTANSNGALSVDGSVVITGRTVLVNNESTASNNGIYDITSAGSGGSPYILTRSSTYNSTSKINVGDMFSIIFGTLNSGALFWQASPSPIVIGSSIIIFHGLNAESINSVKISGTPAVGQAPIVAGVHSAIWSYKNSMYSATRTSPYQTVGFNTPRQPSLTNDTEITFSVTMTNTSGQTGSVTLQISPDGSTWQSVGGQSSAAVQPSTAYYFNKIIQAGYYYQAINTGSTGTTSMSQVTELTL